MHLKSQLRATVEQYEIQQEELRASNEELQAMNEELRSSAEELETSKEELQSVNEELTTVNQELKITIEELSQANNDFTNLMNSTDIGTICDLKDANASLWLEVSERRLAESSRVKLLNQLVTSQEKERQRFARDLHDQLGQQLTILRLKLETLKDESGQRQKLSAAIEEILGVLSHLDSDIDFLAWELRPIILDDLGLKEALRLYVDRWKEHSGIAAEFHSTGFNQDRLPVETENNLYRITQEALNNVAKHSNGSRVSVLLERRDDHAVLIIEDNGQGFKADGGFDLDSGFGLTGMRERALLIGASFEVESNAEKGTTIFVRAPLVSEGGEELK